METKISKSQIEVWEAKEKLFEEIKNIPIGDRISFIQNKVKGIVKKYFKNKVVKLQTRYF